MENTRSNLVKWLQILLYIHIAAILLTALSKLSLILNISLGGNWISWLQRGVNLATMVCLFLLPAIYRKAAMFKAGWLLCNWLSPVVPKLVPLLGMELSMTISSVLAWIIFALSFIALFLEYHTHSTISAQKDAGKWKILFVCSLALSLVATIVAAALQNTFIDMVQNGITWGIMVYNLITSVCILIIEIAYLILLARTIQNVKHEENELW